jgi:hypothetical protein
VSPEPAAATTPESFAFAEGVRETRHALARWRTDPRRVLVPWFAGAVGVAGGLLAAVWVVSTLSTADATPLYLAGVESSPELDDALPILGRNLLVLALHATACVAGFIAGSSMRRVAATKTGISRVIHERAGPVAIAWVVAVTLFSLLTQSLALGLDAATMAGQLGISSGALILTVLPHALIELTAIFLPLAAWLIASRRDEWGDLLAATFVTVAIALPTLLVAVALQLLLWPRLLEAVSPVVG